MRPSLRTRMDGRKLLRLPYWLWTKFGEGQLPSAKLTSVHGAANLCCPPFLHLNASDENGPNRTLDSSAHRSSYLCTRVHPS